MRLQYKLGYTEGAIMFYCVSLVGFTASRLVAVSLPDLFFSLRTHRCDALQQWEILK